MIVTVIGIAVVALVGFWLFGGFVLRVGGLITALAGVFGLVLSGNASGIVLLAIGLAMWLAGHWHFALRHHEYKSPLARRVFCQLLPQRLNPARAWGVPVVLDEAPGDHEDRRPDPRNRRQPRLQTSSAPPSRARRST